ncbi:hypothetical protein BH23VER1_BH23VER1_30170 [soil metagenome]
MLETPFPPSPSPERALAGFILTAVALSLAACGDDEIRSYSVDPASDAASDAASETSDQAAARSTAAAGDPAVASTSPSEVTWATPAQAEELPPGDVRKASYAIPGEDGSTLDLSVTAFPGEVGGVTANVNRWRDQLGLPPVSADDMAPELLPLGDGSRDIAMMVFDMAASDTPDASATSAGILPVGEHTWFFKLTGTSAAVTAYRPAFVDFLGTVTLSDEVAGLAEATAAPPPDRAERADPLPVPPLDFTAPDSWLPAPASSMRAASFVATGPKGETVDIAVIPIPGNLGSNLDNVNRWRQQLQLPDLDEEQLAGHASSIEGKMGEILYVEEVSEEPLIGGLHNAAIYGAIVQGPEHIWFFKMSGDAGLAAEHRDSFKEFVAGASIP